LSKFLLNLLVQISKALVYSKKSIFYSEKNFPSLSAQSAQRPAGPAATHLFFFNRPLPLSPLGLRLSAGPTRCLGPADRESVAPCLIAASHSRKRISRKPHSLHECALPENLPPPLDPYQPARPQPPPGLGLPAGPSRLAHFPRLAHHHFPSRLTPQLAPIGRVPPAQPSLGLGRPASVGAPCPSYLLQPNTYTNIFVFSTRKHPHVSCLRPQSMTHGPHLSSPTSSCIRSTRPLHHHLPLPPVTSSTGGHIKTSYLLLNSPAFSPPP
jgi:hypothetical protein